MSELKILYLSRSSFTSCCTWNKENALSRARCKYKYKYKCFDVNKSTEGKLSQQSVWHYLVHLPWTRSHVNSSKRVHELQDATCDTQFHWKCSQRTVSLFEYHLAIWRGIKVYLCHSYITHDSKSNLKHTHRHILALSLKFSPLSILIKSAMANVLKVKRKVPLN